MSFSPDGKWLGLRRFVSRDSDRVSVWNCADWKERAFDIDAESAKGPRSRQCAFGSRSNLLYCFAGESIVVSAIPPEPRPELTKHKVPKEVVKTNSPTAVFGHIMGDDHAVGLVTLLAFDFDADGPVMRYDLVDPKSLKHKSKLVSVSVRNVSSFCPSSDGKVLALARDERKDGHTSHVLEIWDTKPPSRRHELQVPISSFTVVQFGEDPKVLATGSQDGSLYIWDTKDGRIVGSQIEDYSIMAIAFVPGSKYLLFSTMDSCDRPNCHFMEVSTQRRVLSWRPDTSGVSQACFSPDGKYLATVGLAGTVRVWAVNELIGRKE
jgi:WD40 repeat protein